MDQFLFLFLLISIHFFFFFFQMLGVKRIERLLPTGSTLTVVGEVRVASMIEICRFLFL